MASCLAHFGHDVVDATRAQTDRETCTHTGPGRSSRLACVCQHNDSETRVLPAAGYGKWRTRWQTRDRQLACRRSRFRTFIASWRRGRFTPASYNVNRHTPRPNKPCPTLPCSPYADLHPGAVHTHQDQGDRQGAHTTRAGPPVPAHFVLAGPRSPPHPVAVQRASLLSAAASDAGSNWGETVKT